MGCARGGASLYRIVVVLTNSESGTISRQLKAYRVPIDNTKSPLGSCLCIKRFEALIKERLSLRVGTRRNVRKDSQEKGAEAKGRNLASHTKDTTRDTDCPLAAADEHEEANMKRRAKSPSIRPGC